jgi:predicted nuclease of restriction endonuclease-like (RecB) superfamily
MASKKRASPVKRGALSPLSSPPIGYPEFLEEVKGRIRNARIQAGMAANQQLLLLYYSIGLDLHLRLERGTWGTGVVDRLAEDLHLAFPEMEGFSPRNLRRMRAFYRAYPLDEKARAVWPRTVAKLGLVKWPPAVAKLPWAHNVILLEKCKNPQERNWYAEAAVTHGWSRDILVHQVESGFHKRQGKALTNFKRTLPPAQSDLAEQVIKDPYTFDFLSSAGDVREREIEQGMVNHIQRFLLELGVGFAFVGRQVHLDVGDQDFYVDLLFYHLRLRCFVVVELKAGPFKPEYAGKMNFYLSAVDDQLRQKEDQPSIGIILCKSKNHLIVEYALRDSHKPIGVAAYRLTKALPEKLKGTLPTTKELEEELSDEGWSEAMAGAMGHDEGEIKEHGAENLIRSHSGTKYVECSCGKFYELSWTEWPGFRDTQPVPCPKCKRSLGTMDLDHMTEISKRDYVLKGQRRCPRDRSLLKLVKHHAYKPGSEEWDELRCPKCRAKYQIDTV